MCKFQNIITVTTLGLIAFLTGCATPASQESMTTDRFNYGQQFDQTVAVKVTGGQETNPAWASKVSNEAFEAALKASIEKSGLFSSVIRSPDGDYQLDVQLIELKQPMIGLNFKVTARSYWRLRRSLDEAPIWRENITTEYVAQMGDSLYAVHRLRLANEGAIRENIAAGLEKIAKLDL